MLLVPQFMFRNAIKLHRKAIVEVFHPLFGFILAPEALATRTML